MTRKRAICISSVIFSVALLVVAVAVVPNAFERALKARFIGPEHVFRLSERPDFLSEELAIAKALETLALDGFDTNAWSLIPDN